MKKLGDYRWSSCRQYFMESNGETIADADNTFYSFSKKRAIAVKKYREFSEAGMTAASPLEKTVGSILDLGKGSSAI